MGCSVGVLATAVSALGGLVFGYELGIISGALLQLQSQFELNCVQQEAVVSSLLIGAIIASIIGGWLIDRYGRRASILLSNLLLIGGSLTLSVSVSFLMLIVGRVIVGFAMCVSSMSCCIFVSEMVSPERRGLMVTLYELGVTVGILLAYTVDCILSEAQEGWRYMFGFAVAPSLAQLVSVRVLPSQDTSVIQLQNGTLNGMQTHQKLYTIVKLFQHRDNMRTRTVIGLGLVVFQQFTGQPNVLFYASTIFRSVGFENDTSAMLASIGFGIIKVIATVVAMFCADKVGRRPLLIGGCSVMAVGLISAGFLSRHSEFDTMRPCSSSLNSTMSPEVGTNTTSAEGLDATGRPHDTENLHWVILFCMMAVVAAFSMSFGPMTWVVLSEIFPADVRGRAFAFSSCFNWVAHLIVTFSFLHVIDVMGLSGTFFLYGVIAVAAVVFIFSLLPETKSKSLEDINRELSERRFSHRNESGVFQNLRCSAGYERLSWETSSL